MKIKSYKDLIEVFASKKKLSKNDEIKLGKFLETTTLIPSIEEEKLVNEISFFKDKFRGTSLIKAIKLLVRSDKEKLKDLNKLMNIDLTKELLTTNEFVLTYYLIQCKGLSRVLYSVPEEELESISRSTNIDFLKAKSKLSTISTGIDFLHETQLVFMTDEESSYLIKYLDKFISDIRDLDERTKGMVYHIKEVLDNVKIIKGNHKEVAKKKLH